MRKRRGSTMVEAALIWPLVILCVCAVVSILMMMYEQGSLSKRLHLILEKRAGERNGVVILEDEPKNPVTKWDQEESVLSKTEEIYTFSPLYPTISLSFTKDYRGLGLLKGHKVKREKEVKYPLIDEAQLLRNLDYFLELMKEEEGSNHEGIR